MAYYLVPGFWGNQKAIPIPRSPSLHFPTMLLRFVTWLSSSGFNSILNLAPSGTLATAVASVGTYNYINITLGLESLGTVTPYARVAILNGVTTQATFDLPVVADRDNNLQNFVIVTDFPFTLVNITNLASGNMSVTVSIANALAPSENVNNFDPAILSRSSVV